MVDHDVLLPENLKRHALDWLGIGHHKVDAIAAAIGRVAPGSRVDVSRLHLAGQESTAAVSGVLDRLAECDVLVDATANQTVFNLIAAVARAAGRPMIWLEVFGGGLGGLIARSRAGIDPTPHDMRAAFLQYCTDNPQQPAQGSSNKYGFESEDGEVLVASDAEVAVIAHQAARLVPDCLIPPEQSIFPYSMYLIGLKRGWVFEAPFATIPVSMASFPVVGCSETEEAAFGADNTTFLISLIEKQADETAPPSRSPLPNS